MFKLMRVSILNINETEISLINRIRLNYVNQFIIIDHIFS